MEGTGARENVFEVDLVQSKCKYCGYLTWEEPHCG